MQQLPIDTGTLPAVDPQVSNPRLRGAFVNPKKEIQLLPHLTLNRSVPGIQAIFKSTFNDRIIYATQSEVFYIENDNVNKAGDIISASAPIRMDENTQNQVVIVNGSGAWVFNQRTTGFSQLTAAANGFDIDNPVDVAVLDTFMVVVGGKDRKWIASNANDATTYDANTVITTDNTMGDLTGVQDLDNNLFIFGERGVQRWIPGIERTPNSLPFSQDPTFRDEYGCVSTGSLLSQNNELFYLSQDGQIRMMTAQGANTISNDGIENIINSYTDVKFSKGSYWYHKGHFLYQLTFEPNTNAFVYCSKAQKWSESGDNDLITGFSEFAIQSDGIYELDTNYADAYKKVVIQTPYIKPKLNDLSQRPTLGSVFLEMTQGKNGSPEVQSCFLQVSKDNILYGNRVRRLLSKVGNRLFQLRWYMNIANTGFTMRFELQLRQDVVIQTAWVTFN